MKRIILRKITAEKKRIERRLQGAVKVNGGGPVLGTANIQYEIASRTRAIAHGGIGMVDRLVIHCYTPVRRPRTSSTRSRTGRARLDTAALG